jgi:hypothetical protein
MIKIFNFGVAHVAILGVLSVFTGNIEFNKLNNETTQICSKQQTPKLVPSATFVSVSQGCYLVRIRIVAAQPNGTELLIHSALVYSGNGCGDKDGMVLLSTTIFGKHGGDYLLKDEQPSGESIVDFVKKIKKYINNL